MIDRTSHSDAERDAREKPEVPAFELQPHYWAAEDRYEAAHFRHVGNSGLQLPAISLGLWHNFGDDTPFIRQRAIIRTAFDLGITQFDLANNYGPPFGSAEENFGRIFAKDLAPYRDELIITTKAGVRPKCLDNSGTASSAIAAQQQNVAPRNPNQVFISFLLENGLHSGAGTRSWTRKSSGPKSCDSGYHTFPKRHDFGYNVPGVSIAHLLVP